MSRNFWHKNSGVGVTYRTGSLGIQSPCVKIRERGYHSPHPPSIAPSQFYPWLTRDPFPCRVRFMKPFILKGLVCIGLLLTSAYPAQADWIASRCTYELTNQTSRRIYFFLNTRRTSLGAGETLTLNSCDSAPFPKVGLLQSHPFFSHPSVIFDAKLGNGYILKSTSLYPGENSFTQSGQKLQIKNSP